MHPIDICVVIVTTFIFIAHEGAAQKSGSIFAKFGTLHSMEKLVHWANKEVEMYKAMSGRLDHLQKEKDLIDKFMEDYEESSGNALKNAINPVDTPLARGRLIGSSGILAHRMTSRYVGVTNKLRTFLESEEYLNSEDNVNKIFDINSNLPPLSKYSKWPNWEDLFMSHVAILHMHEIYGFKPTQGIPMDTIFAGVLKAVQCVHIGLAALSRGSYYMAIEWLEFAKTRLLSSKVADNSISKEMVETMLDIAIETHNQKLEAEKVNSTGIFMDLYMDQVYKGQSIHERLRGRTWTFNNYAMYYGNDSDQVTNMLALCSGREFQPARIRSQLSCRFERHSHPYFQLNPLKVEQLSKYPYIVQMYDVLGNDTINWLYKIRNEMQLSMVAGLTDVMKMLDSRTSSGTSMNNNAEFRDAIRKKTEMISGLKFSSNEELLQITEYTYGRYYRSHQDPLYTFNVNGEDTIKKHGDRVATVLYYIEEPTVGGGTPFCQVGISIKPVRGSAVFWFNMNRNGTVRTDISHGACPVIHGSKLVMQQWLRYNKNFLNFPCSLDPMQ